MKWKVQVRSGSQAAERSLEALNSSSGSKDSGVLEAVLDGETLRADWAAVGPGLYSVLLAGRSYEVCVERGRANGGSSYVVSVAGRLFHVALGGAENRGGDSHGGARRGSEDVLAPMPGRIVKILASEGKPVVSGEGLIVIEAMKMQNEVRATRGGVVEKLYVTEGEGVESGSRLVRLG
jgi:biotin carboxyl carrier protein